MFERTQPVGNEFRARENYGKNVYTWLCVHIDKSHEGQKMLHWIGVSRTFFPYD